MKKAKLKPIKKKAPILKGQVRDVKHAFKILGQKYALPDVSKIGKAEGVSLLAYYKLTKIHEAENKLNNNWKPDYTNSDQYKYYVWHSVKADSKKPSGFAFSFADYDYWRTCTAAGSRLYVGNSETALRIAKKFEKLFIDWKLK